MVRLSGSVPPSVASHELNQSSTTSSSGSQSLTLTVTLNRNNQTGFERYLAGVEDKASPTYRHFLTQSRLTALYGPSQSSYDSVLSWFRTQGFDLVQGSANHLTLTLKGSRSQADNALAANIRDFAVGGTHLYANTSDPEVPSTLAPMIASISGLSDLARPQTRPTAAPQTVRTYGYADCAQHGTYGVATGTGLFGVLSALFLNVAFKLNF